MSFALSIVGNVYFISTGQFEVRSSSSGKSDGQEEREECTTEDLKKPTDNLDHLGSIPNYVVQKNGFPTDRGAEKTIWLGLVKLHDLKALSASQTEDLLEGLIKVVNRYRVQSIDSRKEYALELAQSIRQLFDTCGLNYRRRDEELFKSGDGGGLKGGSAPDRTLGEAMFGHSLYCLYYYADDNANEWSSSGLFIQTAAILAAYFGLVRL